ncbi:hypothetical protein [Mesorhizobium sp. M0220]|uniref:hypothetical protein n=1 Tax=Mesorhizobium sp. M0220 TaxID=2956920 RepID=UPI00333675F8
MLEDGVYPVLGLGQHIFLIRDIETPDGPDLLFTLRPERELRKGLQRNNLEPGYSSAPYPGGGSVCLLKQDTLFFAVQAPSDVHPFVEVIDNKMLVKAPHAFNDLLVTVQHDHDDGSTSHLSMWRWQFVLLMQRDQQGKPPIDFSLCEGRIAHPEEV